MAPDVLADGRHQGNVSFVTGEFRGKSGPDLSPRPQLVIQPTPSLHSKV